MEFSFQRKEKKRKETKKVVQVRREEWFYLFRCRSLFVRSDENVGQMNICLSGKCSTSTSNCSRQLIDLDIDSSTIFEREIHFRNNSQWINGLNRWSQNEQIFSADSEAFDQDLRIFYPKIHSKSIEKDKDKSLSIVLSFVDRSLPQRLQELIVKQNLSYLHEDFRRQSLNDNDQSHISIVNREENDSINNENHFQQSKHRKTSKMVVRHPLRSIQSEFSSSSVRLTSERESDASINDDQYSSILKDQFQSLIPLSRRWFHYQTKPMSTIDDSSRSLFNEKSSSNQSKLILQRYEKLQQLLIRSTSSTKFYRNSSLKSTINNNSTISSCPNTSRPVVRSFDEDFPLIKEKSSLRRPSTFDLPLNSNHFDETSSNFSFYQQNFSQKRRQHVQRRSTNSIDKDRENLSLNQSFPVIIAGKRLQITLK